MRSFFTTVILVALCITSAQGGDEHALLKGLAYGPFRDGQRPGGVYPTEAQIRQDLALIQRLAPKIRTYGTEKILGDIPGFCADIGLDCYPGAWLDGHLPSNDQQIQDLLSIAAQDHPTTRGLIVGNETLLRGDLSPAALVAYINSVKASTPLPVTTADAFYLFLNETYDPVVEAVDFLTVHIHPWWFDVSVTNGWAVMAEAYGLLTNRWPNKRIVIGETGWPSGGSALDLAVPSFPNAERFLREFRYVANQLGMDYFYFSAFDEAWKVEPNGVGPHWGVMLRNRQPTPGLSAIAGEGTSIVQIEPGQLLLKTYAGAKYEVQVSTHLQDPNWNGLDTLYGASGTNRTPFTLPASPSSTGTFRLRWVPD